MDIKTITSIKLKEKSENIEYLSILNFILAFISAFCGIFCAYVGFDWLAAIPLLVSIFFLISSMFLVYKSSVLFGEKMDRISSVPYKKLLLALKNDKENGYWDVLECEECHFPGDCLLCGAK